MTNRKYFSYEARTGYGVSKVWIVEPKIGEEYEVWWGRSNNKLNHKTVKGSWFRKVGEKLSKGYRAVEGYVDMNSRFVWGTFIEEPVQPESTATEEKAAPKEVVCFFEEKSEFSF